MRATGCGGALWGGATRGGGPRPGHEPARDEPGGRLEQAREFIIGLERLELFEKQSRAGSRLKSSSRSSLGSSFHLQD